MKKKTLAIMLAVMLAACLLPTGALAAPAATVYVGAAELGSGEYTTDGSIKTSGTPSGDSYAYYKDGVLSLKNMTVENSTSYNHAAIYASGDVEIDLIGTSAVAGPDNTGVNSYGILISGGNLTVNGSGTLNSMGGKAGARDMS